MHHPVLSAPPAEPCVSREELKAHLNVLHDDDDELIDGYSQAAEQHLDGWSGILGRALVEQTWALSLPAFPAGGELELPLPRLIAVDSIRYRDRAGVLQTLNPEAYEVLDGEEATIVFRAGQTPATGNSRRAVTVTWRCGYGAPADVPAPIKSAIKLLVGDLHANRQSGVVGLGTADLRSAATVRDLLANFRPGPV